MSRDKGQHLGCDCMLYISSEPTKHSTGHEPTCKALRNVSEETRELKQTRTLTSKLYGIQRQTETTLKKAIAVKRYR